MIAQNIKILTVPAPHSLIFASTLHKSDWYRQTCKGGQMQKIFTTVLAEGIQAGKTCSYIIGFFLLRADTELEKKVQVFNCKADCINRWKNCSDNLRN